MFIYPENASRNVKDLFPLVRTDRRGEGGDRRTSRVCVCESECVSVCVSVCV